MYKQKGQKIRINADVNYLTYNINNKQQQHSRETPGAYRVRSVVVRPFKIIPGKAK